MSNWSPTYKAVCDICGETQEVSNYGDWACRKCGQGYTYDECHQIRLTDSQWALLRNPPRWIPVQERLPEEGVVVLAYLPKQADVESGVYAAMLSKLQTLKGTFSTSFGFGFEATHWMPLPEPPEVK
jgi:hypothetical protein